MALTPYGKKREDTKREEKNRKAVVYKKKHKDP